MLLVSSLNFNQSNGGSLKRFASPLFLVAISIIYGGLFMILLALNYELSIYTILTIRVPIPDSSTRETSH